MVVVGIVAVVILVAVGIAIFLWAERRSDAKRNDVDVDSMLANLDRSPPSPPLA